MQEVEIRTMAGWPALAQVCRIYREVEYVNGERVGQTTVEWAYARVV